MASAHALGIIFSYYIPLIFSSSFRIYWCFKKDVENDHVTGTGESGWFLFCSFGILRWSRGEDGACWGRATVNFICTSRNTQTNHRERTRGRDPRKGGFARIGGRHEPPFRGNALKPQQSAFWKSWESTMLLQSTFAFRGEPVICWKRLFMCTTQWCLCFSVLDLVKRLLTKVVRMSTAKGPQPNSTSAADRNKVTKSLVWMKSTFQCPGTHSQGSPNNSSRCPNDSPRGTFQYLTLTDIFKLFASRWPRALDLMWRTLQQTSPRFSLGNKICYIHIL